MGNNSSKNKGNVPNESLYPKDSKVLVTRDDINKIQREPTQKIENRTIPFREPQKIDTKQQKGNDIPFYDCSIYPEKFNEKWNYDAKKEFDNKTVIISVLGKKNSGKTKLLSRFVENVPDIDSISKTNGLGIVFPTDTASKNFTFIEVPTLSDEFFGQQQSLNNTLKLYNDSKGHDIIFDFTISISNIIFIVVNDYSFEDIEVINRIKKNVQEDYQKIIVVHNLKNKKTKEECNKYVSQIEQLLKLQRNNYVFISNQNNLDGKNKSWYKEQFSRESDEKTVDIVHIIYGQDNEESGNFFNPPAKEFLQSTIATVSKLNQFNVVNSLNTFLDKESMRLFNAQKTIRANGESLLLEDKDGTGTTDIKYACFYDEDELFVKLELLSTKLKSTFKFERKNETYNFNGKFNLIPLIKFLEEEVQDEPSQEKSTLIKIDNSTHDLKMKQTSAERKNGILTLKYEYKEKQDDDDDDD